jgi:hypothetical protein
MKRWAQYVAGKGRKMFGNKTWKKWISILGLDKRIMFKVNLNRP